MADSKFKNHFNPREAMTPEAQKISSHQSLPTAFQNGTSKQPSLIAANATLTTSTPTDGPVDPSVVDLFCALAENSPELLPGRWSTLFDVIAAEEKFWVYPSAKVGEIEDFGEAAFVPFLRRSALIREWSQLLEHARRVDACRETGRAWGYTC